MKKKARGTKILAKNPEISMSNGALKARGTPQPARWLPRWAVALLIGATMAAGTFALFEFVVLSKLPHDLLGTWRVDDGDIDSPTLEFRRDGTMLITVVRAGTPWTLEGTAAVEGDILRTTKTDSLTGKRETGTQTIIALTPTEFTTEDADGTRITMKRLQ